MEQLEQMHLSEDKPVFDFQAKKAAAKPKTRQDLAMIEVNTEENRLVFALMLSG